MIAAASTATRAGSYALFALGQAAGITLILLGLVTRRLGPVDDPGGLRLAPRGALRWMA